MSPRRAERPLVLILMCPRRATQWALRPDVPPEFLSIEPGTTLRFSRDLDDYVPLCGRCHARLDGRKPPPGCRPERYLRGAEHPGAKLTDGQALEILTRADAGENQHALARAFGISQPAVWKLIHGRTWNHLPRPSGSIS